LHSQPAKEADLTDQPPIPPYDNIPTAPYVYFDIVAAQGHMGGAIQLELAARHLIPIVGETGVHVHLATSARLRCSPGAARNLIEALTNTLKMLEQPQAPAVAASSLN
jgi:hypothetical protein